MTLDLGFIGLGNMGAPMARNLARAGFPLTVFDVRPEPLAEPEALGARVPRSCREVGERSEIVSCVVVDEKQLEAVFLGSGRDEGVLAGLRPGAYMNLLFLLGADDLNIKLFS